MAASLYLIPNTLGALDGSALDADALALVLTPAVRGIAAELDYYLVENAKTARAFLKQVGTRLPIQQIEMKVLDKNTPARELDAAHPGHHHVREDGVEPERHLLHLGERGLGVVGPDGRVAEIFQQLRAEAPDLEIVLHDQHAERAVLACRRVHDGPVVRRRGRRVDLRQVEGEGRPATDMAHDLDVAARLLGEADHL